MHSLMCGSNFSLWRSCSRHFITLITLFKVIGFHFNLKLIMKYVWCSTYFLLSHMESIKWLVDTLHISDMLLHKVHAGELYKLYVIVLWFLEYIIAILNLIVAAITRKRKGTANILSQKLHLRKVFLYLFNQPIV